LEYSTFSRIVQSEDLSNLPDLISIDIFDTLLYRKFITQEKTWRSHSLIFYLFRYCAEKLARHFNLRAINAEVSLAQIYRFIPWIYKSRDEISREKNSIRLNTEMEDLIVKLQKHGKRIFLISNTYYSASELLYLIGNPIFYLNEITIISSSEYKVSKKNGLFNKIIQDFNLDIGNWLHIGDSLTADVIAPESLGIESVLYVNHLERFKNLGLLSSNGLRKAIRKKDADWIDAMLKTYPNLSEDIETGRSNVIKMISKFVVKSIIDDAVNKIDKQESNRNSQLMLYCSRDGWLFYRKHREFTENESSLNRIIYFKTSRKIQSLSGYRNYLDSIVGTYATIGIFDLGWKGSTLKYLEKIYPNVSWKGYFLYSTYSGKSPIFNLAKFNLIEKINIMRSREFIEILFPAPTGSFSSLSNADVPMPNESLTNEYEMYYAETSHHVLEASKFRQIEFCSQDAISLLYLIARYPGDNLLRTLREFTYDSMGDKFSPLVTYRWNQVFSRNKILWPFSAKIESNLLFSMCFSLCCRVKEVAQKTPYIKRYFI
jgi:FMN phosphatase YigB (HAD superfamily)